MTDEVTDTARLRREDAAPGGRGGRRRDALRDAQILRATLDVLAETGYERLTMDAVAARARAGKATLYRRWNSREDLIAEAALCSGSELGPPDADTGSLRGDLEALMCGAEQVDETRARAVIALLPVLPANPRLAALVRDRFVTQWQRILRPILERARARGEVHPDRDLDELALIVPSLAFYQSVFGERPVDADTLRRIIGTVLVPLAATAPTPVAPDQPPA